MTDTRIHRTTSADGTEIAGRVLGNGPPLVLVHGGIGDGEFAWTELLPHLTDRFTCYLPSTRGRGLSADSPDRSLPRLSEDITAFVASIDEPVCLMGWSGGGPLVLDAAAQLDNVTAVAAWESGATPSDPAPEVQADLGRLGAAMEQVGLAAAEGRLVDAVRAFLIGICNDEEIAAVEGTDFHERWSAGIPELLAFFQNLMAPQEPGPDAGTSPARVSAPTLLLVGTESLLHGAFSGFADHLASVVGGARVREVPGVGHFAPVVAPAVVAEELTRFFKTALQPA
jgi:pimeloyl-ACP methyl ester carboxylesterase